MAKSKYTVHYQDREPVFTFTLEYTKDELQALVEIKRKLDKFDGDHDPLEPMVDWLKTMEQAYSKLTGGMDADQSKRRGPK